MSHPNAKILESIYENLALGRLSEALAPCAENCTFQMAGKSALAGKYSKANFAADYWEKMRELSGNSLKVEAHELMASDRHGIVLASHHLVRKGEPVQLRTVHVWRFENGKPVAWYEYPRDLYQFDSVFGA